MAWGVSGGSRWAASNCSAKWRQHAQPVSRHGVLEWQVASCGIAGQDKQAVRRLVVCGPHSLHRAAARLQLLLPTGNMMYMHDSRHQQLYQTSCASKGRLQAADGACHAQQAASSHYRLCRVSHANQADPPPAGC